LINVKIAVKKWKMKFAIVKTITIEMKTPIEILEQYKKEHNLSSEERMRFTQAIGYIQTNEMDKSENINI
jgi:hypothetical protein